MNNQQFFQALNTKAKSYQNNKPHIVDPALLDTARHCISRTACSNVGEAFLLFASFNYFNFACKVNKNIGYGFKGKLEESVNLSRKNVKDVRFFLDKDNGMNILYVSFYGFIFSYHNVTFNSNTANELRNQPVIQFDNIRKQICAEEILKSAMVLNNIPVNKNTALTASRTSTKPNNGSQNNFTYTNYSVDELKTRFCLDELCSTSRTANNIACVLRKMYFTQSMIHSCHPKIDDLMVRAFYRDILIDCYSIIEIVTLEIGAKVLGIQRNYENNQSKDSDCKKASEKIIKFTKQSEQLTTDLKQLRHNVHLSKPQDIATDVNYTEHNVAKWFNVLIQFLGYVLNNYRAYKSA